MYQYLLDIYGGGPDIALQPNSVPYSGPHISSSGSNNTSLSKSAVPLSSHNHAQNVPVHSSSRVGVPSHNQTASSSTWTHCGMCEFSSSLKCFHLVQIINMYL